MTVSFRTDLGDLCHARGAAIPVAVVTDLKGNIIFSNELTDTDYTNTRWVVSGVRLMTTRFWAASTGYVLLTSSASDGDVPDYPLDKAGIERELCVWTGYLDHLRPVIPPDLGTRLLRSFVGVVDVVQATCSAQGGYTIAIQLRDRMKWLMDTVVTFNPAVDSQDKETPLRSNIILETVQRGIGQVESQKGCAVCGKSILWDSKFLYDLGDKQSFSPSSTNGSTPQAASAQANSSGLDFSGVPPANLWYTNEGPLAGRTRTLEMTVPENPHFRIFTTRAPINLQQGPNFLISQQVPLDVLKFLAMQEIYPTEVFQDNRDGNFYYCPRANDASGLKDPKRFFRTYYFRTYPDSLPVTGGDAAPPDFHQMMLAFREEQSSLGLKTNFLVHKNAPMAQGGAQDDWTIHLRTKPAALQGISYACKFTRIFDDTITTAEEAAVVALNAARIMGKDVRAATAVLLGDPSIVPGEVIQTIGSPLQPGRGITNALKDRQTFEQYDSAYNQNLKTYAQESLKNAGASAPAIEGAQVTLPVYDGSKAEVKVEAKAQENQDSLICTESSRIVPPPGGSSEPATIFRVEAVVIKLNVGGKGFTTELALCSPF